MESLSVKKLEDYPEETVTITGWIHKINNLGQIAFVKLRNKEGIIQLVCSKDEIKGLRVENCIAVTGKLVINEKAPGGVEIQAEEIKVLGKVYYDKLPLEISAYKSNDNIEKQLDYRTLSLRKPKTRAIFKVQNEIEDSFRDFFKKKGFSQIHSPKIIDSSTEGGSEMFTVNYFDHRAFLAQSPQFYKQMMVGAGFERVFEVGNAYRAELHNTWRHLNEYVSLDIEMAFIQDENDLMDLEEEFINYLYGRLNKVCSKELAIYKITLPEEVKIPRIPLKKVQDILLAEYGKKSPIGNVDAEGEKLICRYVKEHYGCELVFITEYPVKKRPMYTMPDGKGNTKSYDLIYDGLEITTGGQRINDYEMLKKNVESFGLKTEDFKFYLDTFKYGMPPHGGFAIGLERLTMKVLKLSNIREAALLPRDLKRLVP